jgi:hypothetical protein
VQTGAGQGRESSLKARPGGTASSRTDDDAQVAQLVEQGTENPRVGGSNPSLGTIPSKEIRSLASQSRPGVGKFRLAQSPVQWFIACGEP